MRSNPYMCHTVIIYIYALTKCKISLFINEVVTEQTLFITCELKRIVKRIVLQNIVN
jgi:hypothetical protein